MCINIKNIRMNKMLERKLQENVSKFEMYKVLEKRNQERIKHMETYKDTLEKFSEEEAHSFLQRKKEGQNFYDTHMVKIIRESHIKDARKKRLMKNNHYLIYARKIVSHLGTNK